MNVSHETIGDHHAWSDGVFAYVWREHGATLAVAPVPSLMVGPKGWTFGPASNVQRVYVPAWGDGGALAYGATSDDPAHAWHDSAAVGRIVAELAETGMTGDAFLFQFESAVFFGSADGQAVLRGEAVVGGALPADDPDAVRAQGGVRSMIAPDPEGGVSLADALATEVNDLMGEIESFLAAG